MVSRYVLNSELFNKPAKELSDSEFYLISFVFCYAILMDSLIFLNLIKLLIK